MRQGCDLQEHSKYGGKFCFEAIKRSSGSRSRYPTGNWMHEFKLRKYQDGSTSILLPQNVKHRHTLTLDVISLKLDATVKS